MAGRSVPSISTYQSLAPGFGLSGSVSDFDSCGSLSIRCIEMIPAMVPGSSSSRILARRASLLSAWGRRRTTPSAPPRPWPRLSVMRPTARIMFLKREMFFFDQSVWLASACL